MIFIVAVTALLFSIIMNDAVDGTGTAGGLYGGGGKGTGTGRV